MRKTQITCPHCQSLLTFGDDIAPGTAVPCLVCNRAFVPHSAATAAAPQQAVAPAGNHRALLTGALVFAALTVLVIGVMSLGLWLAFSRHAPAAEVDGVSAPVVARSARSTLVPDNAPTPAVVAPPGAAPPGAVPPGAVPVTADREHEVDLADIKRAADRPMAPTPLTVPGNRSEPVPAARVPVVVVEPDERGIDQKRIDAAIEKGVRYLKQSQKNAVWGGGRPTDPDIGFTALAGLTLLECKVPPTDPSVAKAAAFVRNHVDTFKHKWETYELGLAILFLDRLGNPKDDAVIQRMAMRILSGQTDAGGWTYRSAHTLTPTEMKQFLVFLRSHRPPGPLPKLLVPAGEFGKLASTPVGLPRQAQEPMPGESLPKQIGSSAPDPKDSKLLKPVEARVPAADAAKEPKKIAPIPLKNLVPGLKQLPVARLTVAKGKVDLPPVPRADDNSNTQFALMGLWAARRHDVPAEYSMLLAQQRFIKSQNTEDGGWGYHVLLRSKNTMTCVGLIGMAMGHGVNADMGKNPPKQEDVVIQNGLRALGAHVGTPSKDFKPPQPNLYFLWSLERVAMLYDLKTIGGKDWYAWGAQALVANQQLMGNWANGGYPGANPHCDTCFALLFLKRSNLVADLTASLRLHMIIRDPEGKGSGPGTSSPGRGSNPYR